MKRKTLITISCILGILVVLSLFVFMIRYKLYEQKVDYDFTIMAEDEKMALYQKALDNPNILIGKTVRMEDVLLFIPGELHDEIMWEKNRNKWFYAIQDSVFGQTMMFSFPIDLPIFATLYDKIAKIRLVGTITGFNELGYPSIGNTCVYIKEWN